MLAPPASIVGGGGFARPQHALVTWQHLRNQQAVGSVTLTERDQQQREYTDAATQTDALPATCDAATQTDTPPTSYVTPSASSSTQLSRCRPRSIIQPPDEPHAQTDASIRQRALSSATTPRSIPSDMQSLIRFQPGNYPSHLQYHQRTMPSREQLLASPARQSMSMAPASSRHSMHLRATSASVLSNGFPPQSIRPQIMNQAPSHRRNQSASIYTPSRLSMHQAPPSGYDAPVPRQPRSHHRGASVSSMAMQRPRNHGQSPMLPSSHRRSYQDFIIDHPEYQRLAQSGHDQPFRMTPDKRATVHGYPGPDVETRRWDDYNVERASQSQAHDSPDMEALETRHRTMWADQERMKWVEMEQKRKRAERAKYTSGIPALDTTRYEAYKKMEDERKFTRQVLSMEKPKSPPKKPQESLDETGNFWRTASQASQRAFASFQAKLPSRIQEKPRPVLEQGQVDG